MMQNVIRKHYTQMSGAEIDKVVAAVRDRVNALRYTFHARERMTEKGVSEFDVRAAIGNGSPIEVSCNVRGQVAVLVRGRVGKVDVCVVVGLSTNMVVTVFKNGANDHHKTLDVTQYTWSVDLTTAQGLLTTGMMR